MIGSEGKSSKSVKMVEDPSSPPSEFINRLRHARAALKEKKKSVLGLFVLQFTNSFHEFLTCETFDITLHRNDL